VKGFSEQKRSITLLWEGQCASLQGREKEGRSTPPKGEKKGDDWRLTLYGPFKKKGVKQGQTSCSSETSTSERGEPKTLLKKNGKQKFNRKKKTSRRSPREKEKEGKGT